MSTLQFDAEATKRLLALYVTPDVVAQREQFLRTLAPRTGEKVLDVGAGPGFLAAAIGNAVGHMGRVCGVDISEHLLAIARSHCADLSWVEFQQADAAHLPFPSGDFDAAVATQVLEYVPDVDAALAELHRVVRPGGRAMVVDTDWDSVVWHSSDRSRMDRILAAWEDHVPHPHLPSTLTRRLRDVGFEATTRQVLPLFNAVFERETFSNRIIDLIVPFVEGRPGITRDLAAAWAEDLRRFGEAGDYFFSLNRYLFLVAKRM